MVISIAVFTCGLSLLLEGESHPDRPDASWVLTSWCLGFLGGITLLSAKRLLDCRRPLWLALFIPLPSLPVFAFASGMITSWSLLGVLVVYLLPFAIPAFIACAFYEWND